MEAERDVQLTFREDVSLEYMIKLFIFSDSKNFANNKEKLKEFINEKINSSFHLRPKKELINNFIDSDLPRTEESFENYCRHHFEELLSQIVSSENLTSKDAVRKFIFNSFRYEDFEKDSAQFEDFIIVSRTNPQDYFKRRERVLSKLKNLFDVFRGFLNN
ncbi:hypothetical protein PVNG_02399 [Plasmodium vivax North Korean]|uniref:Type I restriction enzyme R protein C-terminal domain-containing protein n=1 Tax=Plasmodium vivax North Korean TaxID=1035514 RepID=A0A0J9TM65_PLAVI|nr:hypothetical protein PVNG_02399 [Plasmodium vivax North Korean]